MHKLNLFVIALALLFTACGQPPEENNNQQEEESKELRSETHKDFFENLSKLCGDSYEGEEIYRSHHGESMADEDLIMHVDVCEDDHIHIPFHISDDKSRTWMFWIEDGRLRLSHEHRDEDGTPHEQTMYGGYADDTGNEYLQNFPADEYSAEIIEDGGGNVWTIKFDEDLTTFTYRLERDDEKRWRVDFDLENPL